jgi:hypothetical protein
LVSREEEEAVRTMLLSAFSTGSKNWLRSKPARGSRSVAAAKSRKAAAHSATAK